MGRLLGIDHASRKLGDSMRIDPNDPSAKSKQIVSNLGFEALLGGGIHAAGKVKNSKMIKDDVVIQTMRYMELLKELKKSGNKKQKVI